MPWKSRAWRARILIGSGRLPCDFDELSHNVLHNCILKATIWRLIRADAVAMDSAEALTQLCRLLASIEDTLTKRLESAFKIFDENCRMYQYLLKRNHPAVPYQAYDNPVVNAAIENRIAHLRGKPDLIYSLEIYYVILCEGAGHRTTILNSIAKLASEPREGWKELQALLSTPNQVVLIDSEIEKARATGTAKARSFILQISDFVEAAILPKSEAFRVLKGILNFARTRSNRRSSSTTLSPTTTSVSRTWSAIAATFVWTTITSKCSP